MPEQLSPFDLDVRTQHHPPRNERHVEEHEHVRATIRSAMAQINVLCPDGREKAVAFTKLEEAMFWANAALARGRAVEGL